MANHPDTVAASSVSDATDTKEVPALMLPQTALDVVLAEYPDLKADVEELLELMDSIPQLAETDVHPIPQSSGSQLSTEGAYEWRHTADSWQS